MIHMTAHGVSIVLGREYPDNGNHMELVFRDRSGNDVLGIDLYLDDIEEWNKIRSALPKGPDYVMSFGGDLPSERDHKAADAYALEHLNKKRLAKTKAEHSRLKAEIAAMEKAKNQG